MGPSALAASSSHHRCSGLKSRRIKRRKKLNIFCRCFLLFCSLPPRNFLATLRKKVLILELHDSVSIACSARQKEKYFLAPPSQSGVPTSELTFARFSVAFWAPSGGGGAAVGVVVVRVDPVSGSAGQQRRYSGAQPFFTSSLRTFVRLLLLHKLSLERRICCKVLSQTLQPHPDPCKPELDAIFAMFA